MTICISHLEEETNLSSLICEQNKEKSEIHSLLMKSESSWEKSLIDNSCSIVELDIAYYANIMDLVK